MSIRINCPNCQGVIEAKEELLGSQALCPFCRKILKVQPAPAEANLPPTENHEVPAATLALPDDPTETIPIPSFPLPTENGEHHPKPKENASPYHVVPKAALADSPPILMDPLPAAPAPAKKPKSKTAASEGLNPPTENRAVGMVISTDDRHRESRSRLLIMLTSLFRSGNPTDASLVITGVVGAAITALIYLAIWPLRNTEFGKLLMERGWVQYATVYFTVWAAVVLLVKYWKIATQQASLTYDLLPADKARKITPDNADLIESHIKKLPLHPRQSFLLKRLLMALENFKARKSVPEVGALLSAQAETDGAIVDSSYAMLKVLIWAIPILGFIGTVIGISQAVTRFDKGIQAKDANIEVVKEALGQVTNGLAVAFDTTYLGLILSMVIMFPTNSVQKTEEDLLSTIEQYCNENLLPRLSTEDETRSTQAEDHHQETLHMMSRYLAASQDWQRRLEYLETTLLERVVDTLADVREELGKSSGVRNQESGVSE